MLGESEVDVSRLADIDLSSASHELIYSLDSFCGFKPPFTQLCGSAECSDKRYCKCRVQCGLPIVSTIERDTSVDQVGSATYEAGYGTCETKAELRGV